ncbi:MAG: hypothetical protein FWE24_03640 [Defluviitaleaceae bacterium]|nr:hypothetical protein [Defluviitaleaceae bacterium]
MDKLIANVQVLIKVETEHPNLLDPQLLGYLKEWLLLDNSDKEAAIPKLQKSLTDGLDVDLTGTMWEEEWLANGKVCLCDACVVARKCIDGI